ncbi:MAG: hypothetical protein HY332_12655 [Chloroflexi bacterium]|nr:hypothetical protein [Chloroflexota bacterium]
MTTITTGKNAVMNAVKGTVRISDEPARGAPDDQPARSLDRYASDPDVQRLMQAYPLGSRQQFVSYHPAIWPSDWRRAAERAPWGLRRGDVVEVTGYGASRGFPEALLVRRVGDGTDAMIFPAELAPLPSGRTRPDAPEASAAPDGRAGESERQNQPAAPAAISSPTAVP